jgi:lysophospholipase L1-like esterase
MRSKNTRRRTSRGIWLAVIVFLNIQLFAQSISIEAEVNMLALGDSYTIGESVETQERWPHQLMAELRKSGISVQDPDYIATTGWTTQDLLSGIDKQMDREKQYNLVSILIGVNNQYQGIPISTYEPDLRKIIEISLEMVNGDSGKVFMLSIPDYAYTPFGKGNRTISKELDAYNALNKHLAEEYHITRVNITPLSRKGLDEPSLVAGDGLHPSALQYGEWVRKIKPLLRLPDQN